MAITKVEVWTVRFPLRNPVVLESMRFNDRDYTIVRVSDDSGAQGCAYCMARNAPVAAAVTAITPLVIGAEPHFVERLWHTLYAATITHGQRGISLRALSLIDIAIWDLRARLVDLPVWHLFGGVRDIVEVSVGGGYYRERRDSEEIADELRSYVSRGFRLIKVPAGGLLAADEERWVGSARDAVGAETRLAVDAHWTWRTVEDAVLVLRRLEQYNLAWVEDPLWPEAVSAMADLRRRVGVPLAVGDEQSGRWAYQNLLEQQAADIWRVDVTCVGGFSELRKIAAVAATWGVSISTHIYPELHVHAAVTEDAVVGVEYTDPAADIDLSYRFLNPCLEPQGGCVKPLSASGLGFELDWELIEATAEAPAAAS